MAANSSSPSSADRRLIEAVIPWVDRVCKLWFRQEVQGLDNVPEGPALVVGNHTSGITMLEAMGFGARMYRTLGTKKLWHGLAHDHIVDFPVLGPTLVKLGALRATHEAADAAFAEGRKILVFPGGNLEAFRPHKDRHRIVFGERTGFIRLALRHEVPIVPVVFEGGHSGFYVLWDGKAFVRATGIKRFLRVDTWPLFVGLPWGVAFGPLFHLPLPVKVRTHVLPPIDLAPYTAADVDNPQALTELYQRVVDAMQARLTELGMAQRRA